MKIFYYTATGNCLSIAKRFANALPGVELHAIPQELQKPELNYHDSDAVGLVIPTYGFETAGTVKQFIRRAEIACSYIFVIMTYGNALADADIWFTGYCRKHGVSIDYATGLLMIDNYLPMFDVGKQCNVDKHIDEQFDRIVKDIQNRRKSIRKPSPLSVFGHALYRMLPVSDKPSRFRLDPGLCIRCGICERVCPKRNITLHEGTPSFGTDCDFCLACVHHCPKLALTVSFERNRQERYRNEEVSLHEIMQANSQL